jgi:hypothetical protein
MSNTVVLLQVYGLCFTSTIVPQIPSKMSTSCVLLQVLQVYGLKLYLWPGYGLPDVRQVPAPRAPALRARPAYVSIRQHTSAYVSVRQHTSAYRSARPACRTFASHLCICTSKASECAKFQARARPVHLY